MVDKEKVLQFVREKYGEEWTKDFNVALRLYRLYHGNLVKSVPEDEENGFVEVKYFDDVVDEGKYEIECVVFDVEDCVSYKGCPVCKRSLKKGCIHLNKGVKAVDIVVIPFIVMDKKGDMQKFIQYIIEGKGECQVPNPGDLVKVRFYAKKDKEGLIRMYLDELEIVKRKESDDSSSELNEDEDDKMHKGKDEGDKDEFQVPSSKDIVDVLKVLKQVNALGKVAFESLVKRNGFSMDDVKDYVVLKGNMYYLNEEGKKIVEGDLNE